jgi:hypothetical protein
MVTLLVTIINHDEHSTEFMIVEDASEAVARLAAKTRVVFCDLTATTRRRELALDGKTSKGKGKRTKCEVFTLHEDVDIQDLTDKVEAWYFVTKMSVPPTKGL